MHRFFLFGDSHAGPLMRAAKSMELDFAGGSVMAGAHMNDAFFAVKDGTFEMLDELGRKRLALRLEQAELGPNLLDVEMPFLSTVGFNTHSFCAAFSNANAAIKGSKGRWFISAACFEAVVAGSRQGTLAFYAALLDAGKTVFAVRSPQRFTEEQKPVWQAYEETIAKRLTAMGVGIVDVRAETTDARGALRPEFASSDGKDRVHANDDYAKIVLKRFEEMLAA